MISKYMDEQIERIRQMEHRLERASEVLGRLDAVLDEYEAVQEDLRALDQYLGSPEWRANCRADEAGMLPEDLHRGALSEDGIWNVLDRHREIRERCSLRPRTPPRAESTLSQ